MLYITCPLNPEAQEVQCSSCCSCHLGTAERFRHYTWLTALAYYCTYIADQGQIVTDSYCLLPVDLRNLSGLQETLKSAGFDPGLPTYVLSECVLVYMEPQESAALLRHLGQSLPSAVCVVYEQVSCSSPLCTARYVLASKTACKVKEQL